MLSRFARLFSLFCPDNFQQLHISRKHFFAGFGHDAHSGGEKTGQWRFQVKESKEKEKEHGTFQFVAEVFQGTGFLGLDGIDTDVQHSGYLCARVALQSEFHNFLAVIRQLVNVQINGTEHFLFHSTGEVLVRKFRERIWRVRR